MRRVQADGVRTRGSVVAGNRGQSLRGEETSRGTNGGALTFLGRRGERELIGRLFAGIRSRRSGSIVVRGPAGIGKTAFLEQIEVSAVSEGFRVISGAGAEPEKEFAFAGLHGLCFDLLENVQELPEPQRDALGVALGLTTGTAPDRYLVGLAVLNLLGDAAEERPLVVLVDDAHWLDDASAVVVAFVLRRLAAERLLIVLGVRDDGVNVPSLFTGLGLDVTLAGLGDDDSRALLDSSLMYAPMDDRVRDRIIAEARGNPLALLEFPRSASPNLLAGGFTSPDSLTVPSRIEEEFRRRSMNLPDDTRALLLVAAADSTGDAPLLWRAAGFLGVEPQALEPAEVSGLIAIDARVRFRHPLVRSAVYQAASPAERRQAHRALAEATDGVVDADHRAWHRAQSVLEPDEEIAEDLERLADRHSARGGLAAAAAFLQRSTELTPGSTPRARRALEAAYATHAAGDSEGALELVSLAAAGPLDTAQQARLQLLRAHITFHLTQPGDSAPMFLEAAEAIAPIDARLGRATYLTAFDAAVINGVGLAEVAEAVRRLPPMPGPMQGADLLLAGLVATHTRGYAEGVTELQEAITAIRGDERDHLTRTDATSRSRLWLASRVAAALYDDESMLILARLNVRREREAGALAALPAAIVALAASLVLKGDLTEAAELTVDGVALAEAIGAAPLRYAELFVAAWRGDRAPTAALSAASTTDGTADGRGAEQSLAHYALAVLYNGLGEYSLAYAEATRALDTDELANTSLALPELVEAATRSGRRGDAIAALAELEMRTSASDTLWGRGLAARSQALLTVGAEAEGHYRAAISHLETRGMTGELARARLLFGEWLRQGGRRRDAREQLRTAHEQFSVMGADAFAARAARELAALGEQVRVRTSAPLALSERELQIARLAAGGATSREVAAYLFLSHRTVDAHLRNIFSKLGITSRRQLRDLLP